MEKKKEEKQLREEEGRWRRVEQKPPTGPYSAKKSGAMVFRGREKGCEP